MLLLGEKAKCLSGHIIDLASLQKTKFDPTVPEPCKKIACNFFYYILAFVIIFIEKPTSSNTTYECFPYRIKFLLLLLLFCLPILSAELHKTWIREKASYETGQKASSLSG